MFYPKYFQVIAQNDLYLSFPDIIQDKINKNRLLVVYRSADEHLPTLSTLHVLVSLNNGLNWREIYKKTLTLKKHGKAWNCPRLSYFTDGSLNIICDTKTQVRETISKLNISIIKSRDNGQTWEEPVETEMNGMVPDRVIEFKNKLFCANHQIKNLKNSLVQKINWSEDNGKTWDNSSTIANSILHNFCEASVVNVNNKYLLAYLRDNHIAPKKSWIYKSIDGKKWKKHKKMPLCGHRIVAIPYKDKIIGIYRDTQNVTLSVFMQKDNKIIETYDIEKEMPQNKYHFGYAGIVNYYKNLFFITYYIQHDMQRPYIKTCFLEYKP